jgi:UDP-N-acetylmuramate: L-alanyl-gamma-D-glutamyl-meso-diaminopimelate ligase
MHLHILGISGTFMGSLAALANEMGHRVTGSDLNCYPPISDQLQALKIEVIPNYDVEQLEINPDLIVIGNVMSRGMPIIEEILNRKINFTSGPKWLADNILKDKTVIAVSGTHGKTTTSSLIAFMMKDLGIDTGYLIGGVPIGFSKSATVGTDSYFVIEADEYDTAFFDKRSKMIHYNPDVLVINNIEYDHSDIFKDVEEILWQFHQLIRVLPQKSKIIANKEDSNIANLFKMGIWSEIEFFGTQKSESWSLDKVSSGYEIFRNYKKIKALNPIMFGDHNMLNALAAIAAVAALSELKIDQEDLIGSVDKFPGVKRRLEYIGEFSTIKLFDDFAHHPTSINSAIDSLNDIQGSNNTLVVVELASNTMKTGSLKSQLLESFQSCKHAWIIDSDDIKWDIKEEFSKIDNVSVLSDLGQLESEIKANTNPNDNVVIMTNRSSLPIKELLINCLNSI